MTELVQIGKVLKPRGLKGELKCAISISMTTINENSALLINNKEYPIKKLTSYDDFFYLQLDGIATLEQAEKLRGASIMFPRNQINLSDDEVLTADLIGLDVMSSSGKNLGKVTSVNDHGGIIINAKNSQGTEFAFPYEDEFIIETNLKNKQIIIKEQMLEVEIAD